MARFPQAEAKKGSQRMIQKLVNEQPEVLTNAINDILGISDEIVWVSPKRDDNYAEYRDQAFLERLGIKEVDLSAFWPINGPQWDALGKGTSEKLFLVEAKSHIPELISECKASEQSIDKIKSSLEATKKRFNVQTAYDWTKPFYQYANRLAHVNWLNENGFNAWLVNVYAVNDEEMDGPKCIEEWLGAIRLLHRCLGIRENLIEKLVIDVFIDVNDL